MPSVNKIKDTAYSYVLGIESSCDETGVALVRFSNEGAPILLAQQLHSQIVMHQAYGGVVPELASRDHIQRVLPFTKEVLRLAACQLSDIDVVAYTRGPGLAGALLVGAGFACSLAMALDKPVIGINHLEGHLLSPFLSDTPPEFPFLALLVSGGHTQLMLVTGVGCYELLGETVDDAAGEAFDKSAKLMGLAYPGGADLAKLAQGGNDKAFVLPRPLLQSNCLNFSFAGLKTAVRTQIQKILQAHQLPASLVGDVSDFPQLPIGIQRDLAASTQTAIVDVLVKKTLRALKKTQLQRVVVAGGVGANHQLRAQMNTACVKEGVAVHYPELALCTDNGAMIAYAAALRLQSKTEAVSWNYAFDVHPRWPLQQLNYYESR